MSRAEKESAYWRMAIRSAKQSGTLIDHSIVFVTYDEESEKQIHLPYKKFWSFLIK